MAANKRILKALKSAITYLDDSMSAMDKKNENLRADSIWHVAAELEYVLFLFSMTVKDEVDKSKRKLNPKLKKVELGQTLVIAQDLLNKAEEYMVSEKLLDAYNSAHVARHYILKVQKEFAGKKREAPKRK